MCSIIDYESIFNFLKHLGLKKISTKFWYHVVYYLIENFSNCHSRMIIFGSSKSDCCRSIRRAIINFAKIAYLARNSKGGMDRQ